MALAIANRSRALELRRGLIGLAYLAPQGLGLPPFAPLAVDFGEVELRQQAIGAGKLERLAQARGRRLQLARFEPKFSELIQQQAIVRRRGKFAL